MSLSVDSLPPNTLPTVLACETLADGVRLQLWLDPDLPWFTGHFPGAPLLPGVTQIHWVMHYAASLLKLAQPLTIPSYERGVARLLRYDRHP